MAGIVQVDPYANLFRNIGYSAGGWLLLPRVIRLAALYADERSLTWSLWNDFVNDEIKKDSKTKPGQKSSADHMADMYGSVGILNVMGGQIFPGSVLESASILLREFSLNESNFESAVKAILCKEILEADGDIFVNYLASGFDDDKTVELIGSAIHTKRKAIAKAIRTPQILRKVNSQISVKSFSPTKKAKQSGAAQGWSANALTQKRTAPLDGEKPAATEKVPVEYVRKAKSLRKSWAKDLDFHDGVNLSTTGEKFLNLLADRGFRNSDGAYVIWPLARTFAELRIKPMEIDALELEAWDLIEVVAEVYTTLKSSNDNTIENDTIFNDLARMLKAYKEGNLSKGKIRHQLPINIAQDCLLGLAAGTDRALIDLPGFIESESKTTSRRLNKAIIRGTEGALEFKLKASDTKK